MVVLAQTVLNQWRSVQDKSQDSSLGLMSVDDGAEHWRKPSASTIKINTYAATFSNPGQFSFALVARDHTGSLQEARSFCRTGTVQPEIAEAMGIREALSWIKSTLWSKVIIE